MKCYLQACSVFLNVDKETLLLKMCLVFFNYYLFFILLSQLYFILHKGKKKGYLPFYPTPITYHGELLTIKAAIVPYIVWC
jgi:hypothetical protein